MRLSALTLAALCTTASAFQSSSLPQSRSSLTVVYEYIPAGFTPATWKKFKASEEAKKQKQNNLGRLGPKGFQSRSFQSFQEALERGEAEHLMPVFNAKQKLARKEIKLEDIPYMQRGGAWDNTDVKGAQKKKWLSSDKQYADGGFKKEQSVSIFGYGQGLDWTGTKSVSGPESRMALKPKFEKNYKAPNVFDMQGKKPQEKPKKFGWF